MTTQTVAPGVITCGKCEQKIPLAFIAGHIRWHMIVAFLQGVLV